MQHKGIIIDVDSSGDTPVVTVEITSAPGHATLDLRPGREISLSVDGLSKYLTRATSDGSPQ